MKKQDGKIGKKRMGEVELIAIFQSASWLKTYKKPGYAKKNSKVSCNVLLHF